MTSFSCPTSLAMLNKTALDGSSDALCSYRRVLNNIWLLCASASHSTDRSCWIFKHFFTIFSRVPILIRVVATRVFRRLLYLYGPLEKQGNNFKSDQKFFPRGRRNLIFWNLYSADSALSDTPKSQHYEQLSWELKIKVNLCNIMGSNRRPKIKFWSHVKSKAIS